MKLSITYWNSRIKRNKSEGICKYPILYIVLSIFLIFSCADYKSHNTLAKDINHSLSVPSNITDKSIPDQTNKESNESNIFNTLIEHIFGRTVIRIILIAIFILIIIIGFFNDCIGLKEFLAKRKIRKAIQNDNPNFINYIMGNSIVNKLKSKKRETQIVGIMEARSYSNKEITKSLVNLLKKVQNDSFLIKLILETLNMIYKK